MKIHSIIIFLLVFIANSFCFADEIERVSFSLVGGQQSYTYQAEAGNYVFNLENPNNNKNPTVWDSPLYISKRDYNDRCETEILLITDVFYFAKANMILVSSYNGSMRYIHFIDPETGNSRYPEIKAFTEKIDINDQQIEIYPGCECIDDSNHSYQCSSAKVVVFDKNFKPYIADTASDELTKKTIGVSFKGDKQIIFPKTKDAKIISK